jgi:hypothetical protein
MNQDMGNRRKPRFAVYNLTISINGKSYRICNINEYGVGFLIDAPQEFTIGGEIQPMVINGHIPVRVAGIARHVSEFSRPDKTLDFKTGWVCGVEFTSRHNPEARRLLKAYIDEMIACDPKDDDSGET